MAYDDMVAVVHAPIVAVLLPGPRFCPESVLKLAPCWGPVEVRPSKLTARTGINAVLGWKRTGLALVLG